MPVHQSLLSTVYNSWYGTNLGAQEQVNGLRKCDVYTWKIFSHKKTKENGHNWGDFHIGEVGASDWEQRSSFLDYHLVSQACICISLHQVHSRFLVYVLNELLKN